MIQILHPDDQDDRALYSLDDVCQRLLIDRQFIVSCVEYEVTVVEGRNATDWCFTPTAILRIQKAYRLHRDLDIHPASLALVLELLDERMQLQEEIALLRRKLGHWELP